MLAEKDGKLLIPPLLHLLITIGGAEVAVSSGLWVSEWGIRAQVFQVMSLSKSKIVLDVKKMFRFKAVIVAVTLKCKTS